MRKPFTFKRFSLLIMALGIGTISFSQKSSIIGLNVTGEIGSYQTETNTVHDFVAGFGGTFEIQFKKHIAFETGIYYRNFIIHEVVSINNSPFGTYYVREKYLSVPLLYKFNSAIFNFSAGPTFDLYLGWKQMNKGLDFPTESHTVYSKFNVGLMGKVSKVIGLTDKILLEPEIRYNRIYSSRRSIYGIGVSAKYMLTK